MFVFAAPRCVLKPPRLGLGLLALGGLNACTSFPHGPYVANRGAFVGQSSVTRQGLSNQQDHLHEFARQGSSSVHVETLARGGDYCHFGSNAFAGVGGYLLGFYMVSDSNPQGKLVAVTASAAAIAVNFLSEYFSNRCLLEDLKIYSEEYAPSPPRKTARYIPGISFVQSEARVTPVFGVTAVY